MEGCHAPTGGISEVFFIDNSTGWVVMHSDYEEGKTKEGS
jgi:hypothetical protein